jgi:hypothetical protein
MKLYNWVEAITKLKENNKLVFEDVNGRIILKFESGCIKFYDVNDENICLHALVLDREFKLKEEPVSFMEAVKSYSTGKTIRCERSYGTISRFTPETNEEDINDWNYMETYDGWAISSYEILYGKWFIEE